MITCDVSWGSHACDLATGHDGDCECRMRHDWGREPCSQYNSTNHQARYSICFGLAGWSEWMEVGA